MELVISKKRKKVTINDVFRVVDDYLKHGDCNSCFMVIDSKEKLLCTLNGTGKDLIAAIAATMYENRDYLDVVSAAVELCEDMIESEK